MLTYIYPLIPRQPNSFSQITTRPNLVLRNPGYQDIFYQHKNYSPSNFAKYQSPNFILILKIILNNRLRLNSGSDDEFLIVLVWIQ